MPEVAEVMLKYIDIYFNKRTHDLCKNFKTCWMFL